MDKRLKLRRRVIADLSPDALSDVAGGNGFTDYDAICTEGNCPDDGGVPTGPTCPATCPATCCGHTCEGNACGVTVHRYTCEDTCPRTCEPTENNIGC